MPRQETAKNPPGGSNLFFQWFSAVLWGTVGSRGCRLSLPGTSQSSGRSSAALPRAAAAGARAAPRCTSTSEGVHCKWGAGNKGTAVQQGQSSLFSLAVALEWGFSSLQTLGVLNTANKTSTWNYELLEFQTDSTQVWLHFLKMKTETTL